MKKNLIRLLGIAFAVALLSTFLFYRLLVGKLASEEAARPPVAAAEAKPEPGRGVPAGMRAVSIHVVESSGVVALVRPGHRIDIHAVGNRDNGAQLRTVLQNVQVLAGPAGEGGSSRSAAQVLTVLVKPEEAGVLALADSGARIRISLRNPADTARQPAQRLAVSQFFDGTLRPAVQAAAARGGTDTSVTLLVRMLGAAPAAVESLGAELVAPPRKATLQVSAFRPGSDVEARLDRLGAGRQVEVFSASRLVARWNRGVSAQAGAIRLQLVPVAAAGGSIRLRVEPELADGAASRKMETEIDLADRQSCLLTGLLDSPASGAVLERLFPGRSGSADAREFLIVVTPQIAGRVESAALRAAR
ncbi:MAG: Flp pilus assembly protein CpaB [Acidobacteria bacterium]|nr:Flp pilus assembly protein CpaB [Acidobacteriota bacterium]